MKRFLTVIAATAVAAAITIPAIANDSGSGSGSGSDPEATFVNCMRTNGVDIPADTRGFAIKQWIAAHESQPSVTDALKKCAPDEKKGDSIAVASLVACLKSHGLQPPTDPVALKQWLGSQDPSVIKKCGVEIGKADDHGGADIADCLRKNGANVPAGAEGMTLKNWIRDHADEPAVADALKKCAMGKPGECAGPAGGPKEPDDHAPAPAPKPEATASPDITLQQ
jgi:hypothetical protein